MRLHQRRAWAAVLALALASGTAAAHCLQGPSHGGVQNGDGELCFELVVEKQRLLIYADDHGQPVSTARASGLLTLQRGTQVQTAPLKPSAVNAMQATGLVVKAGDKLAASITLADGSIIASQFVVKAKNDGR